MSQSDGSWVPIPLLGLISCVPLDKFLKLSEPHFFCTLGSNEIISVNVQSSSWHVLGAL